MRLATLSLVKCPPSRLLDWISYHVNIGVRDMRLCFDDPHDPAIPLAERFPEVTVYPCDAGFWDRVADGERPVELIPRQWAVVTWALGHLATEADYLLHMDSDELLWAPDDVAGGVMTAVERQVAETDADWIRVPPLEAVAPGLAMRDAFRQVRVFREHLPERYDQARTLGAGWTIRGDRYLRGHSRGKPIIRLGGKVTRSRVHAPPIDHVREAGLTSVDADVLRVLHYDSGTFAEWQAKWQRYVASGHVLRGARDQQRRDFIATLASTDPERAQRQLYRRDYCIPHARRAPLFDLGLLRRVSIDPALFEHPLRGDLREGA